jgi:hypothetical protein
MVTPPAAALPLRLSTPVTVVVDPPTTVVLFNRKLTKRGGLIINWNVLPTVNVAVMLTRVEELTGTFARTVKVPVSEPAGMVKLVVDSSVSEGEADEISTTDPPFGAGPSRVTVPVDKALEPPFKAAGLRTRLATLGGLIRRLTDVEDDPRVAVILALDAAVTD